MHGQAHIRTLYMTKIKPFRSSGGSVKEEYGILVWDVVRII